MALLMLVGGCAHAGDDGAASATAEGGGAPSLVGPGASGGSVGPAIDEDSASPQGGSSGVEDSATTNDASSGGPTSDRPPGGRAGATASGDAASSTPGIQIDAAGVTNVPDAMVVTGGDESSLACPQTCTNGCCDGAGSCLEGTVDDACGGRGSTCQDCSAAGQMCQAGICTAPPAPSTPQPPPSPGPGEPACSAASCSNPCVPYFVRCCKSDDTCGCALLFPRGPCN